MFLAQKLHLQSSENLHPQVEEGRLGVKPNAYQAPKSGGLWMMWLGRGDCDCIYMGRVRPEKGSKPCDWICSAHRRPGWRVPVGLTVSA